MSKHIHIHVGKTKDANSRAELFSWAKRIGFKNQVVEKVYSEWYRIMLDKKQKAPLNSGWATIDPEESAAKQAKYTLRTYEYVVSKDKPKPEYSA